MAGETKSKGRKNLLDKFYTKSDIAKMCIDKINLSDFDLIIEPSAGSGSFSNNIEGCISYDIEPESDSIIKQDWFALDKNQFKEYKNILVIGNPPFGQQNNLAIKFFNSSSFANTIAFILPISFKKDSIQNRLNEFFHLKEEFILPKNSFLLNKISYDIPSVFQIWVKKDFKRSLVKRSITSKYITFTDYNNSDIRIVRVGGNAGLASLDLSGSKQSNYFIKNNTKYSNLELLDIINSIKFPSIEFTIGPKSLSKGELIYELEKVL